MIGSRPATAWLAAAMQARADQARLVQQWCVCFTYSPSQVQWRFCLLDCIARLQQLFLLSTLSKRPTPAPREPGSAETLDYLVSPEPGRGVVFARKEPGPMDAQTRQPIESSLRSASLVLPHAGNQSPPLKVSNSAWGYQPSLVSSRS
jgi:hypothetical protein